MTEDRRGSRQRGPSVRPPPTPFGLLVDEDALGPPAEDDRATEEVAGDGGRRGEAGKLEETKRRIGRVSGPGYSGSTYGPDAPQGEGGPGGRGQVEPVGDGALVAIDPAREAI